TPCFRGVPSKGLRWHGACDLVQPWKSRALFGGRELDLARSGWNTPGPAKCARAATGAGGPFHSLRTSALNRRQKRNAPRARCAGVAYAPRTRCVRSGAVAWVSRGRLECPGRARPSRLIRPAAAAAGPVSDVRRALAAPSGPPNAEPHGYIPSTPNRGQGPE